MKKLSILLIMLVGALGLSGCVVYPVGYGARPVQYQGQGYSAYPHDRDGDGVRDRYDRRPNNPYRY